MRRLHIKHSWVYFDSWWKERDARICCICEKVQARQFGSDDTWLNDSWWPGETWWIDTTLKKDAYKYLTLSKTCFQKLKEFIKSRLIEN